MQTELYAAFDKACRRGHSNFRDDNNPSQAAAASAFHAAAELAKAIVEVEREMERREKDAPLKKSLKLE